MISRWTKHQHSWGTEYSKHGELAHFVPTLRDVKREALEERADTIEIHQDKRFGHQQVTTYRFRGGGLYGEVSKVVA